MSTALPWLIVLVAFVIGVFIPTPKDYETRMSERYKRRT
jgi:hypothetical protein